MSDASRLPAGRKADVAKHVAEHGQVTVTALAEHFAVSADTIRRDLDQLDSEGLIIRTHGGAMSNSAIPWHDTGLEDRSRLQPDQKEQIGLTAARLVADGNVLFINGGTTTLALVRHLSSRRELIIATNSLRVPAEINAEACRDLYVIGGHVRVSGQVTVGPVVFASSVSGVETDIRVDLALLGVGAVDVGGISTSNLDEAPGESPSSPTPPSSTAVCSRRSGRSRSPTTSSPAQFPKAHWARPLRTTPSRS